METLLEILKQTLMIVIFVTVMMLVIEYITLRSKNKTFAPGNNSWLKIIFAAVLGIVPGCLGTFAVVSMYIHKNLGLAALVAALIATSGDEAFIMFSMIPDKALIITGILFIVAVGAGFLLKLLKLDINYSGENMHIHLHKEVSECVCFDSKTLPGQLKNMIWQRAVVLITGTVFLLFLAFSHSHGAHKGHDHSAWGWEKITFFIVTIIGLAITISVPDHFLKKHLWQHIIKKHFLKLFLWTLAAITALHFLNDFINVKDWVKDNIYIIMFVAVIIGLIPESGPHVIFISMFVGGVIPISVLIANSIVQDGHGAIPLLAESPKSFIIAKALNAVIGLAVGYSMLLIGF